MIRQSCSSQILFPNLREIIASTWKCDTIPPFKIESLHEIIWKFLLVFNESQMVWSPDAPKEDVRWVGKTAAQHVDTFEFFP